MKTMGKLEQNKAQKRLAIMEAARTAFLNDGYLTANMDNIAADAGVTKQTVYRYFPSKIELFQATLSCLSETNDTPFLAHLDKPDNENALTAFAVDFIQGHLSEDHLATYRLLIADSKHVPELFTAFHEVGPDVVDEHLTIFFSKRLGIEDTETAIRLWTGALLSIRSEVLMGMKKPGKKEIEKYAREATRWLLNAY